ncbi:hypothetical protein [Turicibacter bilis]|uniref:hypothetical protein n=1 Tax=Turicibacter bilis TaxID=2735723 RepID=UPI003F89CC18
MISLKEYNISDYLLRILNNILLDMVELFEDTRAEDIDDKEFYLKVLFPEHLVIADKSKCERELSLFESYIKDSFHHELRSLHKYMLFYLIEWYKDVTSSVDFIIEEIDSSKLETEDDRYLAPLLKDLYYYKDFLFEDWDFLDYMMSGLLKLYEQSSLWSEILDFDIDEMFDLLPPDLQEKYFQKSEKNAQSSVSTLEDIVITLCYSFKGFIEFKGGWRRLYYENHQIDEKGIQSLFYCYISLYCRTLNIDVSPECDAGRGPVDFKFSNGDAFKTLVEIKKSRNTKLLHGIDIQINEYGLAEETNSLVYLVFDFGDNQKQIEKLLNIYEDLKRNNEHLHLIIIDSRKKESASRAKKLSSK